MQPKSAENQFLGFELGHEIGHHAWLQSSTARFFNFMSRSTKVNIATTSIFLSSLTIACTKFFFGKGDSGITDMHMFLCAATLLQKTLGVASNYVSEFYADRYGANLSSPEEGIGTLLDTHNDNKKVQGALQEMYRGLEIPKIAVVHDDPRVAEALKKMSGVLESIVSKERNAIGSAIKEVKKSQLKDLLVHPPVKWRVKALQKMVDKNTRNDQAVAGV